MNSTNTPTPDNRLAGLLDRLFGRINYERKTPRSPRDLKTEAIQCLLRELGNPQLDYQVIHVAGTKGKGSVTQLITKTLHRAGYQTGCYTSPHLVRFQERILLGDEEIDDLLLTNVLTKIFAVIDVVENREWSEKLTFFDLSTAAAFLAFSVSNREIVTLEVGLGGRLDSTNVCKPMLALITNVSFDHERQLGDTLAKIAFEKAGIIKHCIPTITAAKHPEVLAVIEAVATERQSLLQRIEKDLIIEIQELDDRGTIFDLRSAPPKNNAQMDQPLWHLKQLRINMPGRHQVDNACLAIAALKHIAHEGFTRLDDQTIKSAAEEFVNPGRIEQIRSSPTVILDVAHNIASTEALIQTLTQRTDWKDAAKKFLIVSISRDKDREGILHLLAPHFDTIACTKFLFNPRATDPHELKVFAQQVTQLTDKSQTVFIAESPLSAWHAVEGQMTANDLCCIAGSLFLIAELRDEILNSKTDSETH